MKNFMVQVKEKSIEHLIVTLSAEDELGNRVSRDLDFSGNAGNAPLYGAMRVVEALNELNQP